MAHLLNRVLRYASLQRCPFPVAYALDSTNPRNPAKSTSPPPTSQPFSHLLFHEPAKSGRILITCSTQLRNHSLLTKAVIITNLVSTTRHRSGRLLPNLIYAINTSVILTQSCRVLEQMLNWSFNTGISLLDWKTPNFLQFLEFLCHPPIAWCTRAAHQKYLCSKGQAFRDRPINDHWNLFYRQIDSTGAAKPPSRPDVRRCAKVVKDFFAFYISENDILESDISESAATTAVPDGSPSIPPQANPAQNIPNDLLRTLAKSRPLITLEPHELDWAFLQIADGAVPVLRPEQILFYMAIARFSAIRISHVQSLSQFQKKLDGVWVFDNGLVPTTMMEL